MKAAISYLLVFGILTGLDFATTMYGINANLGTELNNLVANTEGGLSGKFIIANGLFAVLFTGFFTKAIRSLNGSISAPESWGSYAHGLRIGTPYGFFSAAIAVLLTKFMVVISNTAAITIGISLSSILKLIVGDGPLLMWTTLATGIVIGLILAKPVSQRLFRFRHLVEN